MQNTIELPAEIVNVLDPENLPSKELFQWWLRPRNPVLTSDDPRVQLFIEYSMTEEPVTFVYRGGSNPGAIRTLTVSLVFQHEGNERIYISGYCHTSKANRVFALELTETNCLGC